MNAKLVESLVQVIEALPPEDYTLLQEQLNARNIQKTDGICGGYARIRHTRIPVWTIISLQHQGADDVELVTEFNLENSTLLAKFHVRSKSTKFDRST